MLFFFLLLEYIPETNFNGTASLSTNNAFTLRQPNMSAENNTKQTVITEWWTLSSTRDSQFLKTSGDEKEIEDALEMIIYSQTVSPPLLNAVASLG